MSYIHICIIPLQSDCNANMMDTVREITRKAVLIDLYQHERTCAETNCARSQELAGRLADMFELRCTVRLALGHEARSLRICGHRMDTIVQFRMLQRIIADLQEVKTCALLGLEWRTLP